MQLESSNSVVHRGLLPALGLVLCASSAAAQSFNIDCGAPGTQPSATYGAGGAQPGTWNEISFNAASAPLVGLGGGATGVTITVTAAQDFLFDNLGTTGDDQALMDTLLDGPSNVTVTGLAPGSYTIYTYAWAPDSGTYLTNVDVTGSLDPIQVCGGNWPGLQQLNTTYTRHVVVIDPSNPLLEILFTVNANFASCNGLQIVGGPTTVGMNYCGQVVPNSTGNIGNLAGTGSATVLNNDLRLTASNLPQNSFGYFLTSQTQGLVFQPGGSVGVLCLGGAIGRYTGPGQIQNSGAAGSFSLQLNLTQTPTPTGLVSIAPGELWHFQAWHRDSVGGASVSNFTQGLRVTFN